MKERYVVITVSILETGFIFYFLREKWQIIIINEIMINPFDDVWNVQLLLRQWRWKTPSKIIINLCQSRIYELFYTKFYKSSSNQLNILYKRFIIIKNHFNKLLFFVSCRLPFYLTIYYRNVCTIARYIDKCE